MKCPDCGATLTASNINESHLSDSEFYLQYFCFACHSLFECVSDSGDMVEENLELLGEIEYE